MIPVRAERGRGESLRRRLRGTLQRMNVSRVATPVSLSAEKEGQKLCSHCFSLWMPRRRRAIRDQLERLRAIAPSRRAPPRRNGGSLYLDILRPRRFEHGCFRTEPETKRSRGHDRCTEGGKAGKTYSSAAQRILHLEWSNLGGKPENEEHYQVLSSLRISSLLNTYR